MRSLCGLIDRSGSRIDPAWLAAMRATLLPRDGINLAQVVDGPIGIIRGLSPSSPEDAFDLGPVDIAGDRYLFAGIAALANRKDLARALGLDDASAANIADTSLVAAAFTRWKLACVAKLAGIWAFVIWDRHEQVLYLSRDHSSGLEIFYHASSHFFAFACRVATLASVPIVPRHLDADRVARALLFLRDNAAASPWKGIVNLPGGHQVRVDAHSVRLDRYWALESSPDIRFRRDDDYVEAFHELFRDVVAGHLRGPGPFGMTLSGGLDSGSIAVTAGEVLGERAQRLRAFTSVPKFDLSATNLVPPWRIGDEGPMAARAAAGIRNIDLTLLPTGNISPIAGVTRMVNATESPDFGVGNSYWLCDLFDASRDAGLHTLMTGARGNFTVSWTGGSFASCVTRWPPSWATLTHLRSVTGSWRSALLRLLVRPLVPPAVMAWRASRDPLYTSWRDYSPLNPTWFNRQDFGTRMQEARHDPLFRERYQRDGRAEHFEFLKPDRRSAGAVWTRLGSIAGIEAVDPTFDRRIVEFCVGLPRDQYVRDGTSRWLARRFLSGRLPDEIVWNSRRGLQAADLALRIRETRTEVAATLDRLTKSPLAREMLDLPRMRGALAAIDGPLDAKMGSMCDFILLRGIGAGLFILGPE